MIYNKSNDAFEYEGKTYKIGERIIANKESAYAGLIGKIIEIRTDEDKDTENTTPDIYCAFEVPEIPYFLKKLSEQFTELYGEPKEDTYIALDNVIMAPSMLMFETELKFTDNADEARYKVTEDWTAHRENGKTVLFFLDFESAQLYMYKKVTDEIAELNSPFNRRGDADIIEESAETYYEIYEEGWYDQNHYSIVIEEISKIKK